MKDFIKWLGVNEKIAKVAVWLLIIMVFLIVTNTMLESIGFPYYKITYDNLININVSKVSNILSSCIVSILNFYSIVLLVFRMKESKNILKYAILYMLIMWLISIIFNYAICQIFIIGYIIIFCYLYSSKKWKYALYSLIAIIINILLQWISYTYKAQLINFANVSDITRAILSIDYFIIMGIIILVKEIYIKKRGENND